MYRVLDHYFLHIKYNKKYFVCGLTSSEFDQKPIILLWWTFSAKGPLSLLTCLHRYLVRWEEGEMMGMILTNLTEVKLTLKGQTEVRVEVSCSEKYTLLYEYF